MEEFFTNLHIGWWFLAQTLIILVCFISLDNYAYKRTMLFANAIEDLRAKDIPTIPTTVGDEKELNIFFQADQDNIKSLLSKDYLTDEEAFKIMRSAKDVF